MLQNVSNFYIIYVVFFYVTLYSCGAQNGQNLPCTRYILNKRSVKWRLYLLLCDMNPLLLDHTFPQIFLEQTALSVKIKQD